MSRLMVLALLLMFLPAFALAPVHSLVQSVIVTTPGPTGAMTPIIIKPPTSLNTDRIIIYQPQPLSPDLKVIVIPPPPVTHETPHADAGDCDKKCRNQCPVGDAQCSMLCKETCQ
jgi:hypothetical protein